MVENSSSANDNNILYSNFSISGHSFLLNDFYFGVTETKLKK